MNARIIDLNDFRFSEDIFWFMSQKYVRDDYLKRCAYEDLSLAEYVDKYAYSDFENWYIANFGLPSKSDFE